MHVYYLTAMMCMNNIPAECAVVWERGPIKTAGECQAEAKALAPDPKRWNRITCWFRPIHRT